MQNSGKEKRISPFYTNKEAARFLRINPRTLDNWRWSGQGPEYRKHGRTVVYLEEDLIAYSVDPDAFRDKQ